MTKPMLLDYFSRMSAMLDPDADGNELGIIARAQAAFSQMDDTKFLPAVIVAPATPPDPPAAPPLFTPKTAV